MKSKPYLSINRSRVGLVFAVLIAALIASSSSVLAQVNLIWWVSRHEVEMPFWEEMARRFELNNPDITVEIINAMDQGGRDQLMTLILSGMAPDIIRGETDWMPDFAGHQLFLDLTDYIERDKVELVLDEFPQPALDAFRWKQSQYALPVVLSSLIYQYNTVMFDEAGLAYPHGHWTWDEFLDTSRQLTRADNNGNIIQYGVQIPRSIGTRAVVWLWQNGGTLFSDDYEEILIDQSESVEALEFLRALIHDHQVASSPQVESRLGDLFVTRNAAAQVHGPWRRGALNSIPDFHWDIAPLPGNKQEATVILAGGMAVSSESKHPEEAWRFVKYLTSTEAQHIWAENGQSSPARIPVALSDSFLSAGAPEHARYYIDVIAHGRAEPGFPGWLNLHQDLNRALSPMWRGEMDVQRAVLQAKLQGQAQLDQINLELGR